MSSNPIGIFDSGVGGLTMVREVARYLPQEHIIYFGDTKHNPYGPRSLKQVQCFVEYIAEYLVEERNSKALLIACNTAAIAGKESIKEKYGIPVLGPVEAGAQEAVQETANGRIGVVATEGTVKSGAYREAIHALNPSLKVYSVWAPRFVPLVEGGDFNSAQVEEAAREYLQELKEMQVDTLVLGCTHYPYLEPMIQQIMGDAVSIVYPGAAIARELAKILEEEGMLNQGQGGTQEYYVSELQSLSQEFMLVGPEYLGLELDFQEMDIFSRPKTLVLGVIGSDVHAVGNRILQYAFEEAGFNVVNIGVMSSQKEFIEAALETGAQAIMVSSLYGHGEIDCRGFRDKCLEAGLEDMILYVGGNLVIGKRSWPEVRKQFLDMGFDRVYPPGTQPEEAIADLRRDLYCGE